MEHASISAPAPRTASLLLPLQVHGGPGEAVDAIEKVTFGSYAQRIIRVLLGSFCVCVRMASSAFQTAESEGWCSRDKSRRHAASGGGSTLFGCYP